MLTILVGSGEGVTFKLLVDGQASSANDRSCTLVVSAGSATAYFSGDIGKRVERRMLTQMPASVDFLLAPHHGSASSSSPLFVHRLCARFVVFSAGRNNRYGHPREEVVQRYRSTGIVDIEYRKRGCDYLEQPNARPSGERASGFHWWGVLNALNVGSADHMA